MTEPNPPRAVPGPPRPGPAGADDATIDGATADDAVSPAATDRPSFGDLDDRPVAEHVSVFEDEHARLRRELGTIDQL
ncbi:MAG: hypothetical protein JWQ99_3998 [Blastococcus sp.]|jgi:hypothetical protein|nr:hypothetical protein [Blastococcus sp.]